MHSLRIIQGVCHARRKPCCGRQWSQHRSGQRDGLAARGAPLVHEAAGR